MYYVVIKSTRFIYIVVSIKFWEHTVHLELTIITANEFAPPRLEPGSSDCRSDALPTDLHSETSFHRLCFVFVVSVSLQTN